MRKPVISKNKGADQLRIYNAADQRLCFSLHKKVQSLYFLNPKFQASSYLLWLYSLICVDLVGNPEDRFSYDTAQIMHMVTYGNIQSNKLNRAKAKIEKMTKPNMLCTLYIERNLT